MYRASLALVVVLLAVGVVAANAGPPPGKNLPVEHKITTDKEYPEYTFYLVGDKPVGTEGGSLSGGTPLASRTSTQSPSPSAFAPGGVNVRVPALASGEPAIVTKVPFDGSYHEPYAGPPRVDMSTVIVRRVGM